MKRQMTATVLLGLAGLTFSGSAFSRPLAPQTAPPAKTPAAPAKKVPPKTQAAPKQAGSPAAQAPKTAAPDPNAELQQAVQDAGSDSAALVRNLEGYIVKYPDTPQLPAIYHALVESEMQLQNRKAALDYSEKLIALRPDDSESMYLAVTLLEKMPDDASLNRAVNYDSQLIDRVEKATPDSRPKDMSVEDWQAGRDKFTMNLYALRGRMQSRLHKTDEAMKDLNQSFKLHPNADAAQALGEIAEASKQGDEALRQYAVAFLLAGQEQDDESVDRDALRVKMGKLWRQSHDSDAGLGDFLLTAFDKMKTAAPTVAPAAKP